MLPGLRNRILPSPPNPFVPLPIYYLLSSTYKSPLAWLLMSSILFLNFIEIISYSTSFKIFDFFYLTKFVKFIHVVCSCSSLIYIAKYNIVLHEYTTAFYITVGGDLGFWIFAVTCNVLWTFLSMSFMHLHAFLFDIYRDVKLLGHRSCVYSNMVVIAK